MIGIWRSSQIVTSAARSATKDNAVKHFATADGQGATVTQAGGLIAISRWLSEATPPVPDAPTPTTPTRRPKKCDTASPFRARRSRRRGSGRLASTIHPEYEYEYEYRCTEYEYDGPNERPISDA